MIPIGALYIAEAIEDERRRFVEQRRRRSSGRRPGIDIAPPTSDRPSWREILSFRRLQATESRG